MRRAKLSPLLPYISTRLFVRQKRQETKSASMAAFCCFQSCKNTNTLEYAFGVVFHLRWDINVHSHSVLCVCVLRSHLMPNIRLRLDSIKCMESIEMLRVVMLCRFESRNQTEDVKRRGPYVFCVFNRTGGAYFLHIYMIYVRLLCCK